MLHADNPMTLLMCDRHSAADFESWKVLERAALIRAKERGFERRVCQSTIELEKFSGTPRCYAGVSWGKDSVCVADLVQRVAPTVPIVWVRVEPFSNPDCVLVRDRFLAMWPSAVYDENVQHHECQGIHEKGILSKGFIEVAKKHGNRHISGIRGDESSARMKRLKTYGLSTPNTCAPIARWDGLDVFAYLISRDLPIHPAYAFLMDGVLDPTRIRVASLGGERGTGFGRGEWERRYYSDRMAALGL